MKKVFKTVLLSVSLTAGSLAVPCAVAFPSPEEHMAEVLGLSEQQLDAIENLKNEQRTEFQSRLEEILTAEQMEQWKQMPKPRHHKRFKARGPDFASGDCDNQE